MKSNNTRAGFKVLPFNFLQFDPDHYLLTNDGGEYHFLKKEEFLGLLEQKELCDDVLYDLKSKNFLAFDDAALSLEMLATKYRTRMGFLRHFTALHMMVVTLRCNHQCRYCQVKSQSCSERQYDMSSDTALQILKHIFSSPSKEIKIEFQGGEPLLNWPTIVDTVLEAEKMNREHQKKLSFVVCTNLTLVQDSQLEFFREHGIQISTSLDGPKELHDENRIMGGKSSSYEAFIDKLALARKILGNNSVSALLTVTRQNITELRNVVDEYRKNNFSGIFLRPLNPYGMAVVNADQVGYTIDEFLRAYEDALDYIVEINLKGCRFVEYYTALLLRRILTPFSTGFVDLQSPSGAGISGVIYDYNGDVYPADEGRMLARMGDARFRMGNVFSDSYYSMFKGCVIEDLVTKSCLRTLPGCSSCAYQPFCGADPIRNYVETHDLMGHRPTSEFCRKHQGIFNIIFRKLKSQNQAVMDVFWSWLTQSCSREGG